MARSSSYSYRPNVKFVANKAFKSKRLQRLLNSVTADANFVCVTTAYKQLNKVAPRLVYDIAQRRGFNSYTGAMAYAYGAALVLDGQQVGVYEMEDDALMGVTPPPTTIRFSRTGRAYARMQPRPKHGKRYWARKRRYKHYHGTGKYSRVYSNLFYKTRYLKNYENQIGYHKRARNNRRTRVENFIAYKKSGRPTSWRRTLFHLQMFNAAPYAAMVQAGIPSKGIPGYDVIAGGRIRGSLRHGKIIVRDSTIKEMDRAMHNYCKYWRSSKGEIANARLYRQANDEW